MGVPRVLMVHGAYRYCIEYHIAGPLPRAIHKNKICKEYKISLYLEYKIVFGLEYNILTLHGV